MVKLTGDDLNEIKKLMGQQSASDFFSKNSARKMSMANRRKAENENLAILVKKIPLFVIWPQVLKQIFGQGPLLV